MCFSKEKSLRTEKTILKKQLCGLGAMTIPFLFSVRLCLLSDVSVETLKVGAVCINIIKIRERIILSKFTKDTSTIPSKQKRRLHS